MKQPAAQGELYEQLLELVEPSVLATVLAEHNGAMKKVREVSYDDNTNQVAWVEDARGNRWHYFYDGAGRLYLTEDPNGGKLQKVFDLAGRDRIERSSSGTARTHRKKIAGTK